MVVAEFTWRVKVGFVLVLLAWIFNLICFVTPFWLVSWPRIHTPFNSLGLWEFCLNGYMVRSDPTMRSYFGCWWVFAPEFSPIQKILMPSWFRAVQAFVTLALIVVWAQLILFAMYICKYWKHALYMARVSKCLFFLAICCVLFTCLGTIIFGVSYQDAYWMPYPELSWPSWSFGMNILCAIAEFGASFYIYERVRLDTYASASHEEEFKMTPASGLSSRAQSQTLTARRAATASQEKLDPTGLQATKSY